MIKIAICDDDPNVRKTVKYYLDQYANAHSVSFDVLFCGNGDELLGIAPCDLILLDIDMPGLNGMLAARKLREREDEAVIIFITNMVQYALEGYEVKAYHFIKKPVQYVQFAHVLQGALQLIDEKADSFLSVKNGSGIHHIRVQDIVFAETCKGHVLLHTQHKKTEYYDTMFSIEKALEGRHFFRCHTSYLINLACIEQLGATEVLLMGGHRIPVSKHRRRELVQTITDYWGARLL